MGRAVCDDRRAPAVFTYSGCILKIVRESNSEICYAALDKYLGTGS